MKSFVLSRLVLCVCLLPLSAGAQLVPSSTESPSEAPTESPSEAPTESPSEAPTESPSEAPTESPSEAPTESPSEPVVDGFTLDFLGGEHSRDSNSSRIKAHWSGTQLEYSGPHPPCTRGRCAHSALTIELSPEQVARLRSTLTAPELLTSFEEAKDTNGAAPRRWDEAFTWGGGEPNLSEEARKRLDALEMLIARLRIIAEPHFPKPGPQAP